ncbi:MAG: MarR family transcriptional regulator [Desulfobacteraceae bacterium]|nr:MarR family transcriptional regulator [Desulfobacteraceae bacterium]
MNTEQIMYFRRITRKLERLNTAQCNEISICYKVTVSQCHILLTIFEMGEITIVDLATELQIDKSTVSRTIESLVRQGRVKRKVNQADRRYMLITLSKEGEKVVQGINQQNNAFYKKVFETMNSQLEENKCNDSEVFGIKAFAQQFEAYTNALEAVLNQELNGNVYK